MRSNAWYILWTLKAPRIHGLLLLPRTDVMCPGWSSLGWPSFQRAHKKNMIPSFTTTPAEKNNVKLYNRRRLDVTFTIRYPSKTSKHLTFMNIDAFPCQFNMYAYQNPREEKKTTENELKKKKEEIKHDQENISWCFWCTPIFYIS